MTKILYSPGYGAGWLTWSGLSDPEAKKFVLTYPPIIEYLESGETFTDPGWNSTDDDLHPILRQFKQELADKFGEDSFYLGGAYQLKVEDTHGRAFNIDEYDGYESVEYEEESEWIRL